MTELKTIFKYKFEVRGYELDSFGHVNNAVYLNYIEQARWEIIKMLKLHELFQAQESFLVVVEANIKYINELRLFDEAEVTTKMHKRGFFLDFIQNIHIGKKKIAKATIKCLFVDKQRSPLDIPDVITPYLHEQD